MNRASVNKITVAGESQLATQLARALKVARRAYRKIFKRCTKELLPSNVHALRVETRRLLALVDLCDPLLTERSAEKISRCLKEPFKSAGRLRDTQVMLRQLKRRLRRFPEAACFKKELQQSEIRLRKQLEQKLQRTRLKKLKSRLNAIREQLCAAANQANWRRHTQARLRQRVDRAFANVTEQRQKIVPSNPLTIHRTRIAFKKFRYMVEELQPLLPGIPNGLLDRLHGHQKLMGDIQDCETFLATLDRFLSKEKSAVCALNKFRRTVESDHMVLTTKYLRRADELFTFWKPTVVSACTKL